MVACHEISGEDVALFSRADAVGEGTSAVAERPSRLAGGPLEAGEPAAAEGVPHTPLGELPAETGAGATQP